MPTVKLPSGEVIEYQTMGGTEQNPVYYNTKTITPASQSVSTPIQTQPTIQSQPKQTIGDIYGMQQNPSDTAFNQQVDYYKGIANQELPTEESLFESKRKAYQAEIDALNKVYQDKIAQARVQGQGRLGSSTALQARSGLLGSDFGQAQTENIKTQNREIEDAYQSELGLKISQLLGKAREEAVVEAQKKREAKEAGGKTYIEYLTAQDARKKQRVTDFAKSLLAQGVDIKKLTDAELSQLATNYGVTKDLLVSTFASEQAAKIKNEDAAFTLSEGQQRFVLNPTTGQYEKVAAVSKTKAGGVGGGVSGGVSGGTSSNKYASDLDAVIGATLSIIPTKFGQQTFQNQLAKARNDGDRLNLVASQVLKGASTEIRNDYSNQAIAVKQLDKAIAELDAGVKSGFLNSKAQYVAGVFGKDFDPKLQKVQAYITSAIQPYRNSVTGAAWGTQEDNEYADLFGSTKYSPTELKNRLTNMKQTLISKSATSLNTFVNPLGTYGNPFETGATTPTPNQVDPAIDPLGIR